MECKECFKPSNTPICNDCLKKEKIDQIYNIMKAIEANTPAKMVGVLVSELAETQVRLENLEALLGK